MCDGRTLFLKDSLPQSVYGRLITPDGMNVKPNLNNDSGWAAAWSGSPPAPLSEGDFQ
jgi:hypothetical protein